MHERSRVFGGAPTGERDRDIGSGPVRPPVRRAGSDWRECTSTSSRTDTRVWMEPDFEPRARAGTLGRMEGL